LFPGSGLYQKKTSDKANQEQLKSASTTRQKPTWVMAAEWVETSRNFARLVAKIQPDWIEQAAKPLLKIHYSEPFWSQKAGRAMVKESGLLYGLSIYSGRRKNLSDFDKAQARDWFIENALLERTFNTRSKILKNNWKVQDEAEQIQDRERRRDLVVSRDWFINHYQQHLPEKIHNAIAFERWSSTIPASHSFAFHLDDICSADLEEQQALFPDQLVINQVPLSVRYQFLPGHASDGMHIEIPLLALNQFSAEDFQWLVPGLFDELLVALIRGLPKAMRKQFVPVPEYARAAREVLHKTEVPLYKQLATALQKMSGQLMSARDFEAVELLLNLQPNFIIIDQDGEELAQSRDLEALQKQFKHALKEQLHLDQKQREFESFPNDLIEHTQVVRHGETDITTYQGLRKTDTGYILQHTDSADEMAYRHEQAVLSLVLSKSNKLQRELKDYIHELGGVELAYAALGKATVETPMVNCQTLYEDLITMTAKQQYALIGECVSEDAFNKLLAAVRANALPDALEIQSVLDTIFKTARDIRKQVDKPRDIRLLETAKTIQQRLYELLFQGFIHHSTPGLIRHYPRYLKGLLQRLTSAMDKPLQARERNITWDKYWQQYIALPAPQKTPELRQMMEEFHIMIFAQQLGTRIKVSEKRLDEQFKQSR
jgi:ATP-dependent helicase HrpA